jgi:hypothetical protein
MADWDNKEQADDMEDEIIELTDIISTGANSDEEEPEDELIELTEIVEKAGKDSASDIILENSGEDEDEPELFFDYKDKYLKYEENKTVDVHQEELEAALERVIEKQYADKIESFLLQTVKKVIEKEISELKKNLQKDFEKIGGVR